MAHVSSEELFVLDSVAWFVEVVSSSFDSFEFVIFEFETFQVIGGEAGGSAGSIKIRSWDVWEFDLVFISGEDGIDIGLCSSEDEFSALAPVLNWSPLGVDKEMLGDCD